MKTFGLVFINMIFLLSNSCFSLQSGLSKTDNQINKEDTSEICEKIAGKWSVDRIIENTDGVKCSFSPCSVGMGPIELNCSDGVVKCKALLGVNSRNSPPENFYADISSKTDGQNILLSFENKSCLLTYKISNFKLSELGGEVSSENCKVLNKEVNYVGKILLNSIEK